MSFYYVHIVKIMQALLCNDPCNHYSTIVKRPPVCCPNICLFPATIL